MANFRHIGTDFTNGVRAPYYANGRLLTAEDLQNDQRANLERIAQTGQGAGQGIVEGLNVSAVLSQRTLRVTAGLGINGNGIVIQLQANSIDLPIQPVTDDQAPIRRSGRFGACEGSEDSPAAPLGDGAYLLTVAPLARLEGAVPRQTSNGTETATCANQWEVEGVQFKLIRLVDYQTPTVSRKNRNRNLLAHWFYGSQKLNILMRDPFQFDQAYSGFDEISAADLTSCDLPLAAFFWEDNQISFVDEWAARRRLFQPYPNTAWKANLSDQRKAEGEARFLQFQDHIAALQKSSSVTTGAVRVADRFAHLPPVGFLPVNPFELIARERFDAALNDDLEEMIAGNGQTVEDVFERVREGLLTNFGNDNVFSLKNFFDDLLPNQYQVVHEDVLHTQLQDSWVQPTIQVPRPGRPGGAGASAEAGVPSSPTPRPRRPGGAGASAEAGVPSSPTPRPRRPDEPVEAAAQPAVHTVALQSRQPDFSPFELVQPDGSIVIVDPSNLPNSLAIIGTNTLVADNPLIDILVTDELIAPYQQALTTSMMQDLISAAIESLNSGGSNPIGNENLTAIQAEISDLFIAKFFIDSANSKGIGTVSELRAFEKATKTPIFYVAFVRHRPEVVRHTLRASE